MYNTTVGYDTDGRLAAAYRKIHLFDALGYRESDNVAPGNEVVIAQSGRSPRRLHDLLRRAVP